MVVGPEAAEQGPVVVFQAVAGTPAPFVQHFADLQYAVKQRDDKA